MNRLHRWRNYKMAKALLLSMGFMIKQVYALASHRDSGFKELISSRNLTVVFRTGKKGDVVQYTLRDGLVYLGTEDYPDPDLAITVSGTLSAALMLMKPTPKLLIKSLVNAILNDDLKIEFRAESLMWILKTAGYLPEVFLPALKQKKKSSKKRGLGRRN